MDTFEFEIYPHIHGVFKKDVFIGKVDLYRAERHTHGLLNIVLKFNANQKPQDNRVMTGNIHY